MNPRNPFSAVRLAGLALLALVSGLSACQPTAPPAAGADPTLERASAGAHILAPAVRTTTALPADFPAAAVAIYQPSTLDYTGKLGSGRLLRWMVVADTADPVDRVASAIAANYRASGAKVLQTPVNADGVGQMVTARNGYGISITYSRRDGPGVATRIAYTVNRHPPRRRGNR